MEFRIQRYQGDDDEQVVSSDKQSDIFQARIEERRRKRSVHLQQHGDNEICAEKKESNTKRSRKDSNMKDGISKEKKKKSKLAKSNTNDIQCEKVKDKDEINTTVLDSFENGDIHNAADIENNNNNNNIENLSHTKKKKKKKKKVINPDENMTMDVVVNNEVNGDISNEIEVLSPENEIEECNGDINTDIEKDADLDKTENCITEEKIKTSKKKHKKHKTNAINDMPTDGLIENNTSKSTCENSPKRLKKKSKKIKSDQKEEESESNEESEMKDQNNTESIIENDNENIADTNENSNTNEIIEKHIRSNEEYFPILGKQNIVKKQIVKRTLPKWLNEPVFMAADIESYKVDIKSVDYLSETTLKNLTSNGIEYLFPVQSAVVQKLISQNTDTVSKFPPQDMCVQAPTGSGKTLAYTLPIIDILSKYIVRQLYCLVVLPSKDLAVQVKKVFESYVVGTNLKVALASGLKTFAKEQEKLVTNGDSYCCSKVHILVCTPGRLVDHLKQTPGFTLKHLRFLVVDEADRLLGQDYNNWLEEVKLSVHSSDAHTVKRRKLIPITASTFLNCQLPFQKLLFSATLTQNPEKIAPLELYHPILFASKADKENEAIQNMENVMGETDGGRFIIPEKLEEKMIVVEVEQKPLVLVHLMLNMGWKGVLCFTKSIESTHRLCLLLRSFQGFTVAEFSSSLSETQRKGVIRDFNNGQVDLLVSSDAMSRGMDINTVKLVVNYDTATNAKTYVHRVGRTARAGKEGHAITILSSTEVYHFKLMIKKLSGKVIPKMNITKKIFESYQEQYQIALSTLQGKISSETRSINAGYIVKRT